MTNSDTEHNLKKQLKWEFCIFINFLSRAFIFEELNMTPRILF